jgi:hypothetical protein
MGERYVFVATALLDSHVEFRWSPPGTVIFNKVLRIANWKVQELKNVLQNFPNELSIFIPPLWP